MVRACVFPARLRPLILALIAAVGCGIPASASPMATTLYYQTDGWVGSGGPSDPAGPIMFTGASHATNPVSLPGQFSLGNFDVASLPGNNTELYANTPFHVIVKMGLDSAANTGPQAWATSEIEISGVLNGMLVGNNGSSVVATVNSVQQVGSGTLPFSLSNFQVLGPVTLTPFTDNPVKWPDKGNPYHYSLSSPLTGQVSAVNAVPEPTTMAVFCAGIAGYLVRRRACRGHA